MVEKKRPYSRFVAVVLLFAAMVGALSASQGSASRPDEREIKIVIGTVSSRSRSFGYASAYRCCSRGKALLGFFEDGRGARDGRGCLFRYVGFFIIFFALYFVMVQLLATLDSRERMAAVNSYLCCFLLSWVVSYILCLLKVSTLTRRLTLVGVVCFLGVNIILLPTLLLTLSRVDRGVMAHDWHHTAAKGPL